MCQERKLIEIRLNRFFSLKADITQANWTVALEIFEMSESKQTFRRGNNTSQQVSGVPNWAQKLVVKSRAVGQLAA